MLVVMMMMMTTAAMRAEILRMSMTINI